MMMVTKKIAAIAQLCSTSNKFHNLYNIAKCAGYAKRQGASMLFLPECLGFIGSSANETLQNAEKIPSVATTTMTATTIPKNQKWCNSLEDVIDNTADERDLEKSTEDLSSLVDDHDDVSIVHGLRIIARKSGLYISGGGIHELGAPSLEVINDVEGQNSSPKERVYNTHIILNEKGDIEAKYRKIHLFDVSIPSQGINLCESKTTAPGSKLVVCDSPIGKLGLSTCYDVRFGEMYTELVKNGGAEILLVPSAFTVPTGVAHWHALLRARAIENQCYVLAAAQVGVHNEKRKSYGHSIGIDPWGEIMSDAGGFEDGGDHSIRSLSIAPKVIFCEIDKERINSVRERMPIQIHRDNCPFSWN